MPYKECFKHQDGDLCLVMAYCEGGDLFHYIKQLRCVVFQPLLATWCWYGMCGCVPGLDILRRRGATRSTTSSSYGLWW